MKKLVIFGVGLIGGSLALALKRHQPTLHVVGSTRSGESLQAALDLGVIDAVASSPAQAMQAADICVIAAPVAQTPGILQQIAAYIESQTIITDVGSTKTDVIASASAILGQKFPQFVPGHPIAGAEKSGVAAAQARLFDGKNVVLTPLPETQAAARAAIHQMWEKVGAEITEMSAQHHDQIFAAVSHLPHLLAFALVHNLATRSNAQELFSFAASGFRDFTRIAGSSPEMWRDISLANRAALLAEVNAYQHALSNLQHLLEQGDGNGLQALFEQASQARNAWADLQLKKPSRHANTEP